MRARISALVVVALAMVPVGCAVGEARTDRVGNRREPTTVTIGIEDNGHALEEYLVLLADRLTELSDGGVQLEVRNGVVGGSTAWDQRAIAMAAAGDFDAVAARAGAWRHLGVTSLDPLQLPGLVDSDAQADRVARDADLVDDLLGGLDGGGFVGFGLFPEAPRYLMLLDGTSDFSPEALRGRSVRAPASETAFSVLESMGMRPVDVAPADFTESVVTGAVTVTEGHLERVGMTVTASGDSSAAVAVNMPLYTKFLVLAVREGAVPQEVVDLLRRASAEVLDAYLEARTREPAAALEACAVGGRLIQVPGDDRRALLAAAAPAVSAVEAGPTGYLVAAVRSTAGQAERPDLRCDAGAAPTDTPDALRAPPERPTGAPHDVAATRACARSDCQLDTFRSKEQQ